LAIICCNEQRIDSLAKVAIAAAAAACATSALADDDAGALGSI
jgi:hypothetical protein